MDLINRSRLGLTLALAAAVSLTAYTAMAATKKVPLPRSRPAIASVSGFVAPVAAALIPAKTAVSNVHLPPARPVAADAGNNANKVAGLSAYAQANIGLRGAIFASRAFLKPLARPAAGPFSIAPTIATSAADIA